MRGFVVAAIILGAAYGSAGNVLPEMQKHLDFAKKCLASGDLPGLAASTDLILLNRIRVYVNPAGSTPEAAAAFDRAMDTWTDALNGGVKFTKVDSPLDAQVVVRFRHYLSGKEGEYGGYTTWKREVSRKGASALWNLHADVSLRTTQPGGKDMTEAQVTQAALHELGHVLGLDDSKTSGDVMAPLDLTRPVDRPQPSEVRALQAMRATALRMRDSLAAKVRE